MQIVLQAHGGKLSDSWMNNLQKGLNDCMSTIKDAVRVVCLSEVYDSKILFGREFKNLNIVTQKSYGGRDTGLHGARLDVYIEEGDEVEIDSSNVSTIYDIEPDKNNKRKDIDFIAQRTRFYHAIIDSRSLKSGQSYDKLKRVFVEFIDTVADAIGEQLIENRFIQLMSIYRSKKSKGELYKHAICKAQIIVSYVKGSTYFT